MYQLSKEMSSLLEGYGFEYGEDYTIEWVVGESECNTMFNNPEMLKGDKLKDYNYIISANKDEEVLMYGEKD